MFPRKKSSPCIVSCNVTAALWITLSCCLLSSSQRRDISAYASGLAYRKDKSSNSFLTLYIPRSLARGAKTSNVSFAIFTRFSGFKPSSVRMLCKRSASLTMMMRTSSVMARNICAKSSDLTSSAEVPLICCDSLLSDELTLLTLVSPSTILRTAVP